MSAISLDGIVKSFDGTPVLKSVDLAIEAGEFLTLVGPSGCGKSTLLRIIAGLESADQGHVRIGAEDVTETRPADRNLAMVFQSYALYPHLTVAENMMTPLRMRDLSRAERLPVLGPLLSREKRRGLKQQVGEVADLLQITHLLGRKPGQLSGGQRQRVALGRAMVRQPVAFLMDEPLSNLDAALRVDMRAELAALHRRLGATFIYVTHDQAEALTMSDRMAVMKGGVILQLDTPDEIYNRPANLAVARFVGSPAINVIAAHSDGAGTITAPGLRLGNLAAPQGPVSIGVRPEHLRLSQGVGLSGRVSHRENLGSDVFLHVIIEGHDAPLICRATPEEAASLPSDALVMMEPDHAHIHVFDAAGQRVAVTSQPVHEVA
ncbi:MAG: ABC transporter ATP-binding protein [Mangrovicoccus sp.]